MDISSRSESRGYTLTEMLTVIAIIAAVATMTIPAIIPLMRGRHLRSAASIMTAALLNARMYAVTTRSTVPLKLHQATDFVDLGSEHRANAYLQTFGDGEIQPSELPQYVQIYPFALARQNIGTNATVPTGLAWATNLYTLVSFRPDGTPAGLSGALRLYLVDLRSVTATDDWINTDAAGNNDWTSDWSVSANTDREAWQYLAIEINPVTGRVKNIDPDQPD